MWWEDYTDKRLLKASLMILEKWLNSFIHSIFNFWFTYLGILCFWEIIKALSNYLETGKDKTFVMPEYQRPCMWSDEQIQPLLGTGNNIESTYFLGTIVDFENDSWQQEIVDGQQLHGQLLRLIMIRLFNIYLKILMYWMIRDSF